MTDFKQTIRALRKVNKVTQRDLAEKIGVDFTYISKIENGRLEPPSEEVIIKIANELGINQYYLTLLAGKVPTDFARVILKDDELQARIMEKMRG